MCRTKKQFDSIFQKIDAGLNNSSVTKFLTTKSELEKFTSTLEPTLEFYNSLRPLMSPLSSYQKSFLSGLKPPTFRIQETIDRLAEEAEILDEYEPWAKEEKHGDEYEPSNRKQEVRNRIAQVRFLPIRIIDAITNNPQLMHGITPREFERLIAELLYAQEFENIVLTSESCDGGRDVLATKFVAGIPLLFAFECKRYAETNKIGVDILRTLLGTVNHASTKATVGVLVTTSTFTKGARDFIVTEPHVDGKDFNELVTWVNDYKNHNT
ncbi:restriction endonuclease [Gimesia aquarii]|nr:restriction endonuclease [Gimesia aquarii]